MPCMIEVQSIGIAPAATVHLRLVQRVAPPAVAAVPAVLGAEELPWLGDRVHDASATAELARGLRRFQADLGLPAGPGASRPVFRKAAYVDLGRPVQLPGGWHVEIGWRAASLAPLFPAFGGQLTITGDSIVLEGEYAPPGGDIGVAVDRALLNIAARKTAVWLLRVIADALDDPATAD